MSTTEVSGNPDGNRRPRPKKEPATIPQDLSEQLVAGTLRGRRSKCSHGCGSDGGCATGGCGVGSLGDKIARAFEYADTRRIIEVESKGFVRHFVEVSDPELPIRVRDRVIFLESGALRWGVVSMVGSLVHAKRKAKRLSQESLPQLERVADEADLKKIATAEVSERQAFSVCKTRIEAFELPMTLVEAEWQFDHRKLTFFFVADGRVDFRGLVRDVAAIFNTRIDLRQIPARDAAKRLGGMGVCGRELCCTTHLGRYEHITLDHARIQQISTNPSKLSGQCGRLKCCLLYEFDAYVEGLRKFPRLESRIATSRGQATVEKIDLFGEAVWLQFPESTEWEKFDLKDLRALTDQPKSESKGDRAGGKERAKSGRQKKGKARRSDKKGSDG